MQPHIDSYQAFYQEAHIPSSLYFSLPKIHGHGVKKGPKYPIVDSNIFEEYVQSLGVSSGTHVVAY